MRMLAAVLACLAYTGHSRQVLTSSRGPAYQTGVSGRVGAPSSRDAGAALAALLLVRGGITGVGDVRGGFGFVEALPMTQKRSAQTDTVASSNLPVGADMDEAADIPPVSGTRKFHRGSVAEARKSIAAVSQAVLVQGGSLKTWSFPSSLVNRVQVVLTTDGRPLDADVQLWQGPDNTPCSMRVYSEDGSIRPFSAVIAIPYDGDNTVAVRNIGQIEFPLAASVTSQNIIEPISDFRDASMVVQGGALRTYNFDTSVESVEIMLRTDGRPLNARIEVLQGPNNNKQVVELHTEDGLERPFFAIIDTLGSGNVVRVVNTAPMEFPMVASVQPHSVNERASALEPVIN